MMFDSQSFNPDSNLITEKPAVQWRSLLTNGKQLDGASVVFNDKCSLMHYEKSVDMALNISFKGQNRMWLVNSVYNGDIPRT